jgi:hypothetical protein
MKRLSTWERKILRRVYRLVLEQLVWRIRTNQALRKLYEDLDIVADILRRGRTGLGKGSLEI